MGSGLIMVGGLLSGKIVYVCVLLFFLFGAEAGICDRAGVQWSALPVFIEGVRLREAAKQKTE